jgi:hypothetical protein
LAICLLVNASSLLSFSSFPYYWRRCSLHQALDINCSPELSSRYCSLIWPRCNHPTDQSITLQPVDVALAELKIYVNVGLTADKRTHKRRWEKVQAVGILCIVQLCVCTAAQMAAQLYRELCFSASAWPSDICRDAVDVNSISACADVIHRVVRPNNIEPETFIIGRTDATDGFH